MGYCGIIDNLRVLPSSHARWKLFLICTMLCFCGYFIYYKFGDRLTAFPVRRASQGVTSDNNISRGLLHDKNDGDYAGEELEEVESDDGLGEDLPHETFPMMRRRLPQVIIIGVKKGGTQALLDYLRLHPDVVTAGGEPHFFNRHYEKGLDWYRKLITEKNFVFDTKKGFYCTRKAKEDYKIPHCLGKGKGRAHPVVRPELIQQLKKFYKPFNRMFYKIVGQDFGWD